MDEVQQFLASMSRSLGPDAFPGEPTPFLVTYDYTESGRTGRYGFICQRTTVREAAEAFWVQHLGEWFRLISVNGGGTEWFWSAKMGTFVTIPGREGVE